jgi:hypothetical protein
MIGLADRYGRVHESEDGHTDIGLSDPTVFPADGFGLYLFIERAAQTTRDVTITRDMRR